MSTATLLNDLQQKGNRALTAFQAGNAGAEAVLKESIRDLLDLGLTRRLSQLSADQANGIRRLHQTAFDAHWARRCDGAAMAHQRVSVLAAALSAEIGETLAQRVLSHLERDENERLRKNMLENLSLSIEGALVDTLTLKAPLEALRHANEVAWQCLMCHFYLGFTQAEIVAALGLSTQQVRTRINQAVAFLGEALK